jgi:transcription initiation factor TFIIA small subunit
MLFADGVLQGMATIELYRRSSIGNCLTETLDYMVSSGKLAPELAIQVLVQFDKVC